MPEPLCIAVGGGGTGGHIIPALAILRALKALEPNINVLYIGAPGSMEQRLATDAGYRFEPVWISGVRRSLHPGNLLVPLKAVWSVLQVVRHLRRHRVDIALGTGGYSSWPACAAARLTRRRYVLQEQNAYPGLVTRLLAGGAARVYLGYESAERFLRCRSGVALHTGNPTHPVDSGGDSRLSRRRLGLEPDRRTLLITGGSRGALTLNRAVAGAAPQLLAAGFNLIWQTGEGWSGSGEVEAGERSRLLMQRFLNGDEMVAAYAAADLAVARCGAITLAELAAAGLPALLVPYPHAAEGHQEANAKALEAAGAAKMILDRDFNSDVLLKNVNRLMHDELLSAMSREMLAFAAPDAAERIARDILSIIRPAEGSLC